MGRNYIDHAEEMDNPIPEAPLIFLIAGTGAAHNGGKNYNMARAFYQAGFHVVSISSPTYNNFVTAASTTGVVGHAQKDAEDIYQVFEKIWGELGEDIEASWNACHSWKI